MKNEAKENFGNKDFRYLKLYVYYSPHFAFSSYPVVSFSSGSKSECLVQSSVCDIISTFSDIFVELCLSLCKAAAHVCFHFIYAFSYISYG